MRKIAAVIIFCLVICTSAVAESWRVFDNAGIFSQSEIEELENEISVFQRKTNVDFVVLTTDDYLGSGNQQTIADAFFDSGNFGFGRLASGLIYYIDMNQRYLYVSTAGEMITVFEDYINDSIEACTDFMANEDYKDAVLEMIDWAKKAVAEADSNAQAPTKP